MTTVLVLAAPPRAGSLPGLDDVLDAGGRERLATAFLRDAVRAGAEAAGDLLVAVRETEDVDGAAQARVREALEPVEGVEADGVRLERQVGSTPSARLGNAVTHLLSQEDASSVLALWPRTPLVDRSVLDGAAMKLRQRSVVLGPAPRGHVSLAGFAEAPDFTDALRPPALETLTARASDAGLEVDFVAEQTRVESTEDLLSLVVTLRARTRAGRRCPPHTTAAIDDIGLRVEAGSTLVAD
jgi:glycosyltransferase A (GT-A) superfamily protein (DUF2064 family)